MEFYFTYILMGVILLPGIIYASVVSARVNSAFKTYANVFSSKGITAEKACEMILHNAGVRDVKIVKISGHLTDNYNPTNKTLSLSESVYGSTSLSALGVAAHEAGHAIQHAQGYSLLKIRSLVGKVSNLASSLLWPLIIVGIIFSALSMFDWGNIFLWGGVGFFSLSLIFSLVTLPVETNASKRALNNLVESNILDNTEVRGAKVVLNAAAKTYVAALVVSAIMLLRFVLSFLMVSRND